MKEYFPGLLREIRTAVVTISALVMLVTNRIDAQSVAFSDATIGTPAANPFAASSVTKRTTSDNSSPDIVLLNPANYAGLSALFGSTLAPLTEPSYVFRNTNGPLVWSGENVSHDLIDARAPAFAGYNVNAPFGQDAGLGVYINGQFTNAVTSLGTLTFGSVMDAQFKAVVGLTVTPEPTTIVLVAIGLLGVLGKRMTRKM